MASIGLEKETEIFNTYIEVPVGSTDIVHVPSIDPEKIMESGRIIKGKSGIIAKGYRNGYAVFSVGSGNYNFESVVKPIEEDKRQK